jgi:signal transduction histidine kinase/ligand-binding sensor domain-containing protein/DNA-binding response OmpR family regulator
MFTVDNDLSSSMINSVYQDCNGIIWIATEDGLNRYDGAKFTLYKHDKDDPYSLLNNYVRFLFEDSQGRCFVGTLSGLQSYDPATDRFCTIPLITQRGDTISVNVSSMVERKGGEVLVGTAGRGIFRLAQRADGSLEARQADGIVPSSIINLLHEDKRGSLWVGTGDKGLFRVDRSRHVRNFFSDVDGNNISSLCEDDEGHVYIGILGSGLYRYDFRQAECIPVPYPANPELPVKSLCYVAPDEIYIGTDGNGMKVYNIRHQRIEEAELNITTFDLNKAKLHAIMKDRMGNLWLGFFQKGVMVLPAITNAFRYLGYKSAQQNIIGSNCVMSVCKDHAGTLWVGTDNDGLYHIGPGGELLTHYEHSKVPTSVPATIMCVYEDSQQNLWIGSYMQGMAQLDPRTGRCRYISLPDGSGRSNMRVYSFAEDGEGNLWIATMGYGLYRMNLSTGHIVHCPGAENGVQYPKDANVLPSLWLTSLLYTPDGKLYIGSYSGLTCLDTRTMDFASTYRSNLLFGGMVVYSLYADDENHLWVGTSEGLKCLDIHTGATRGYTTREGLPNNTICAIAGDKNKELWLSTNYGVARFNPLRQNFVCYYANDGLQGNEFSKGAVCTDKNGEIFFGGVNGVTYFNPLEISDIVQQPDIHITGFYLHNRSVKKGMTSGREEIIDRFIMDADRFYLSHNDNSFSIEFSSMEFGNPERITYMYTLNDDRWVTLRPGINRVSFSDLSPGDYRFSVRAKDYTSYSDVRTVTIVIRPAWYASAWANWAYLLLGIALVYAIILQVRHRYRVRQELMEHVHQEQLGEAKLQFFINISHEIRTPMTLIITPLQKLMAADGDPARQKVYRIIYRNAERLLALVNQLMDMRKIDKGQMRLKFREVEIVGFVRELCGTFEYQSRVKDITFSYAPEIEELSVWMDPKNFDKVVLNVLSNAFKYTPEKGSITLRLRRVDDEALHGPLRHCVEIEVEDSGIGIDEQEIGHIFDRFYQVRNQVNSSGMGTGIGLHLTRSLVELHHGTIGVANNEGRAGCHFTIRLPLGNAHLQPEEIEEPTAEPLPAPHATLLASPMGIPAVEEEKADKPHAKTKHRVLVVEDDEEIRKYICRELADKFHTVESTNGREALNLILKKAPDLIISDIMMPEMDGLTLCRKIRQNVNINHIPVVLLTARASEVNNLEGLNTGADAYLVKPFNIDILKKTAENLILQRERLRNTFSGNQTQADKVQPMQLKSPDEKLLERVMNVINANISNPALSVEMIASDVGISRVHLHRKLKELTNQSTRDFIRNTRLRQAANLLAEKHHNITEVAIMTGFANVAYFSTAFKEMYGVPPSEFRKIEN